MTNGGSGGWQWVAQSKARHNQYDWEWEQYVCMSCTTHSATGMRSVLWLVYMQRGGLWELYKLK